MNIIGYHSRITNGKFLIQESSGETVLSANLEKLFNFLLEPYDYPVRVVWTLDEFVAPMLHLLGGQHCLELAKNKVTRWQGYKLFYIPQKVFSIHYEKYFSQFFDLSQYYQDTIEPPFDAFEVKFLANKLEEVFARMGLQPQSWTSPAKILKDCAFNRMVFPTVKDNEGLVRRESVNYALHCCHGNWITSFKAGHWPKGTAFDYDLTSAYPAEAMQLYDTRPENCRYIKSNKFIPDADWAFLYGEVKIDKDFSPIMYGSANRGLCNPVGQWRTYLTLDELNFIEKHKLGTFNFFNGWFLKFKNHKHIFNDVLQKLYSYRGKHFLTDALAKRMMNSLYGITLQRNSDGSSGEFFNPFFGAQITTRCRLKVAESIIENGLQNNLVSINTDGFLVDKPVPESKLGIGMGTWKFCGSDATIVASPGWVLRADKKPHGITYQTLRAMIAREADSSVYSVELKRRFTMNDAIEDDGTIKEDKLSLIGQMHEFYSSLNLNSTRVRQSRVFREYPETGEELLMKQYVSEPIVI